MNCCYHRDPSISPSAATWKSCTRGDTLQHITCFPQRVLFWHTLAVFSCSWLPACNGALPLLKAMQTCQILIQIAVLVGFTPTASIVQFSPSQPSPLLSKFFSALHCLHACVLIVIQCLPHKGGTPQGCINTCSGRPSHRPCPLVYLMCKLLIVTQSLAYRSYLVVYSGPWALSLVLKFISCMLSQVTIPGFGAFHSYLWPILPCFFRPCLVQIPLLVHSPGTTTAAP